MSTTERFLIYLCLFILLFCNLISSSYSIESPILKQNIEKDVLLSNTKRPRLFLTPEKIQFIKSKLIYYPYSKFWKYVKKRADKYARENPPVAVDKYNDNTIRALGNRLPYMAIAYLLTKNEAIPGSKMYLNGIKKWMNALCSYPNWASNEDLGAAHILFGMSVCYDWLYNEFTPEERAIYRAKITKHAQILYHLLISKKKWWSKAYLQNHNYTNVMALAVAGLALYGEVKEAKDWIRVARENFRYVLYWLSSDGSSHEGVGYWSYGTEALLKYFMALAPIFGLDEVKSSLYFQKTAYFRLHMSLPDFKDNVNYGDSPYYDWYGPGYILRCLASIFNDGHAQWLAKKIEIARGKKALYSWLDLIWYDENIKPIPPDNLPTYAYFENLGIFVNRTSWSPNSIWVFFKAGPPLGKFAFSKGYYGGAGHVHPDEGNFLLWAYGKWLIVDNGYSFLKSTVNHNVFLFNGVGQLGEGRMWFNARDVKKYHGYAQIKYIDFKDKYKYIVADLTKIYPPQARLKKWIRTWIFLPEGYLILKDDIEMKNIGYAESFLHLGPGYIRKTNYGFLYRDYDVGFKLYEVSGEPFQERIEPTNFIGKKGKTNNSRFTLHFIYKEKKISAILVLKIFRKNDNRDITFLKKDKNNIEFVDDDLKVKIDFLKKMIKIQ